MSNLDDYKKDVFEQETNIAEDIVSEYFKMNEQKKQAEKWLKDNGGAIKDAMVKLGKDKKDIGEYRVSVSIPDTSKFDEDKVLVYLQSELTDADYAKVIIPKLNESALESLIEEGIVDIEKLKEVAWVESSGAPSLSITKVKK